MIFSKIEIHAKRIRDDQHAKLLSKGKIQRAGPGCLHGMRLGALPSPQPEWVSHGALEPDRSCFDSGSDMHQLCVLGQVNYSL